MRYVKKEGINVGRKEEKNAMGDKEETEEEGKEDTYTKEEWKDGGNERRN